MLPILSLRHATSVTRAIAGVTLLVWAAGCAEGQPGNDGYATFGNATTMDPSTTTPTGPSTMTTDPGTTDPGMTDPGMTDPGMTTDPGTSTDDPDDGACGDGVLGGGEVHWASPRLSVDNGAMVARAGRFRLERGEVAPPDVNAAANMPFPGLERPAPTEVGI